MRQSILIGRMNGAPQLRETAGGTPVLNFELVTRERRSESFEDHAFKLVVFGENAKRIAKQAKDGSEIVAICKPESRQYTDKSGRPRRAEDHNCTWIRVCVSEGAED